MNVLEFTKLLQRFPETAIVVVHSDADTPLLERIHVYVTGQRLGSKWRWPLNTSDAELPDWSKPDPVTP